MSVTGEDYLDSVADGWRLGEEKGRTEERVAIVKWLRFQAEVASPIGAEEIERGAHLEKK